MFGWVRLLRWLFISGRKWFLRLSVKIRNISQMYFWRSRGLLCWGKLLEINLGFKLSLSKRLLINGNYLIRINCFSSLL